MNAVELQNLVDYIPEAELHGQNILIDGCCFDSRKSQSGELFVALKGEQFDAHDFLEDAISNGAAAVLVNSKKSLDIPQIVVADTQVALGYIGSYNRDQFVGRVVGLTGSAGKTTSKEMIASVLSEAGEVLATQGNLNNEIGVPQTLLALSDEYQFAVVEMGAAKAFDIEYLMQFVRPQVGVLLNALPAHIEGFGDLTCVAKTKSEVINCLDVNSTAVLNLDTNFSKEWLNNTQVRKIYTYSADENFEAGHFEKFNKLTHVQANHVSSNKLSSKFELVCGIQSINIVLNAPGKHNVSNALAAASVGFSAGLSLQEIANGLEKFTPVKGRMSRHEGLNDCLLIDDSYNSNPEAMNAAIDVLSSFDGDRVLVMSDMGELGSDEKLLHENVGEYAKGKVDQLWSVGELSKYAGLRFGENAKHFESQQALIEFAQSQLTASHVLLVKGSRYTKMDNVVKKLNRN